MCGYFVSVSRIITDIFIRTMQRESWRIRIPGILHTVNPVANDAYPIYKENSREYSLLKTENFRTMLMMEVGALLCGGRSKTGQEGHL